MNKQGRIAHRESRFAVIWSINELAAYLERRKKNFLRVPAKNSTQ
jgi:hypothetical protein